MCADAQIARVLTLILAVLAPWTPPAAPTQLAEPRIAVTVRVYRFGGPSLALQERALIEAERVLRTASVEVRWQECTEETLSPACAASLGPFEFLLRFVGGPARRGESPATLGDAIVIPRSKGVLATVYLDRASHLAESAHARVEVVLGRVVAHEIGHLLMRTPGHPRHGLMRSNWTVDELRRNHAADWAFTVEDVAEMHQRRRGW